MTRGSIKCTNCGGNLDIPEGYNKIFCLYCGTPNLLTDVLEIPGVGLKCLCCGKRNKDESIYCSKCGSSLQNICPFCEEMHSYDITYCPKTGCNIKEYIKEFNRCENKRRERIEELDTEIKELCTETDRNMVSIYSTSFITIQICRYNVTNKEFCVFLNSEGNQIEDKSPWINITDNEYCGITGGPVSGTFYVKDDYENHPVVNISWYGAVAYCNWLSIQSGLENCYGGVNDREYIFTGRNGYRLPTEGEWEYACRAGSKTVYYWGNYMENDYCWYEANSGYIIHPVGQKKPNAFGLYDMNGNVSEWCYDRYKDSPTYFCIRCETKNRTSDLYCKKCGKPVHNPAGKNAGKSRIHRGGNWRSIAHLCTSSSRRFDRQGSHSVCLGFRLTRNYFNWQKTDKG